MISNNCQQTETKNPDLSRHVSGSPERTLLARGGVGTSRASEQAVDLRQQFEVGRFAFIQNFRKPSAPKLVAAAFLPGQDQGDLRQAAADRELPTRPPQPSGEVGSIGFSAAAEHGRLIARGEDRVKHRPRFQKSAAGPATVRCQLPHNLLVSGRSAPPPSRRHA
jgi:hypothetical protein